MASGYSSDTGTDGLTGIVSLMKPFDMDQLQTALESA